MPFAHSRCIARASATGVALIDERNTAARLRAQKVHAWALVDPDWLGGFTASVGARLMPLGQKLKFAMPLDERLIDTLAVAAHENLEPTVRGLLLPLCCTPSALHLLPLSTPLAARHSSVDTVLSLRPLTSAALEPRRHLNGC